MHIIFRLSLIVTMVAIAVHCQGARGGGGSRSGIRGGNYRTASGGSRCQGDHCGRGGVIAGSVIGGLFGVLAVIFTTIYCYRRWRGRPLRSNAIFVVSGVSEKNQTYETDHFRTGIWSSRYYQYNKWNGPHRLSLSFDPKMSRVDGQGTDNIGTFTIDGMYSSETHRIVLTKIYKQETGNPTENFGHKVTIQLTWNADRSQFEGKWFVETRNYCGEDKFELKFEKFAETLVEETKY